MGRGGGRWEDENTSNISFTSSGKQIPVYRIAQTFQNFQQSQETKLPIHYQMKKKAHQNKCPEIK